MKNLAENITKGSKLLSAIKSEFPDWLAEEMEGELNLMIERAYLMKSFNAEEFQKDLEIESFKSIKFSIREKQVLFMLEKGMKNREMATQLNNNEKSVSTYVARIKKKLFISLDSNTYQLVKLALMLGLVPTSMPEDKPKKIKPKKTKSHV